MRKFVLSIFCVVAMLALARSAAGQGWQPEQVLLSQSQTDQLASCNRFPGTTTTVCLLEVGSIGSIDLYEIQSSDGGVTWSSRVQVTSDAGDEFDQFVISDAPRGRISVLYSKNAFPGNQLLIRHKYCTWCAWTAPVTIPATMDGRNHWDASLLLLTNGDLLAIETLDGPDSNPFIEGKIRSIRSTDGGASWGSANVIFDEPGQESFAGAVLKADGVIHLMFRDPNHGTGLQIGQLWSEDNGYTWIGHSVFQNNGQQTKEFYFIGSQGGYNETVLAQIQSTGRVNHWQSWDNGNTWEGPYQTPTTTQTTRDGRFSMGCRGVIFTYSTSTLDIERRYDWYSTCQ